MNLDELNEELGLNLETEYYDTVSGYLIEQLGQIPQPDEHPEVQIGMLRFTVQSMEGKRIRQDSSDDPEFPRSRKKLNPIRNKKFAGKQRAFLLFSILFLLKA